MKRLLATGPLLFISDPYGLPLLEDQTHVVKLWCASANTDRSAKLHGAIEREERDKLR